MNLNQTFSVLFWLNKSKANKKGLIPIWVRITVDGKRAEYSVKRQILPEHWNPENGQATREWIDAPTLKPWSCYFTVSNASAVFVRLPMESN